MIQNIAYSALQKECSNANIVLQISGEMSMIGKKPVKRQLKINYFESFNVQTLTFH